MNNAVGQSYNARNADKITGGNIETLAYIAESTAFFRILKILVGFVDDRITDIQNIRNENNSEYRNIMIELEKRQEKFFS